MSQAIYTVMSVPLLLLVFMAQGKGMTQIDRLESIYKNPALGFSPIKYHHHYI